MQTNINIIDLFAGPGGLGEGFSAFTSGKKGAHPFRIRMSVEKEISAHKTLTLRALYRLLAGTARHSLYHDYIEGRLSLDELILAVPNEWAHAQEETLYKPTALGEDNKRIHRRLEELKKKHAGEPWVVIGGPPCQAYSLAGRSRNKGIKGYSAEADKRHFLYQEYLQVLAIIQPDIFVMENVKGILTSKVDGERIFPSIRNDLINPFKAISGKSSSRSKKYSIYSFVAEPDQNDLFEPLYIDDASYIIRCENYGIPQARHRVILLGVSTEITRKPEILQKEGAVSIEQVLSGLPILRSKISKQQDTPHAWADNIAIQVKNMRKDLIQADHKDLAEKMERRLASLKINAPTSSPTYQNPPISNSAPEQLQKWLLRDQPKVVLNHESRGHIAGDLGRYFFSSCWAETYHGYDRGIPKASDFPEALAPQHANWKSGHFADRFRVQQKGRPATTITSHISKDGHYYIHYDSRQCRSLTVREAARIQTFPDNYFFEGNRTQQYVQVGNAVPPFLARKLADIVFKILGSS